MSEIIRLAIATQLKFNKYNYCRLWKKKRVTGNKNVNKEVHKSCYVLSANYRRLLIWNLFDTSWLCIVHFISSAKLCFFVIINLIFAYMRYTIHVVEMRSCFNTGEFKENCYLFVINLLVSLFIFILFSKQHIYTNGQTRCDLL